jgi:hypothetical protein
MAGPVQAPAAAMARCAVFVDAGTHRCVLLRLMAVGSRDNDRLIWLRGNALRASRSPQPPRESARRKILQKSACIAFGRAQVRRSFSQFRDLQPSEWPGVL